MSRPIEQALNNLIPRHSGVLPPELIDLARSLLAQSRTRASTLKAEEEIGRTYACANIACERLKTTLDLPPIEPRPPIPPRVYAKLYNYFDRTLVANSRRKSRNYNNDDTVPNITTPTKAKALSSTSSATPQTFPQKQKQTPSKATSLDPFRENRAPRSGLKYTSNADRDARIPPWLAPVVRKLCSGMDTKLAIPHVLAGVESIICLPKSKYKTETKSYTQPGGKLPALVAAIWFFAIQELTGTETSGKEFRDRRVKILEIFKEIKADEDIAVKIVDANVFWQGWEDVTPIDVQGWIVAVTERGYLEMDWYTNIGENGGSPDVDIEDGQDDASTVQVLRKRKELGRTMEDGYDYSTQEVMADHAEWLKVVQSAIDDVIADGAMDLDTSAV